MTPSIQFQLNSYLSRIYDTLKFTTYNLGQLLEMEKLDIFLCTTNKGKIKEIDDLFLKLKSNEYALYRFNDIEIFKDLSYVFDLFIKYDKLENIPDVNENQSTFLGNARLKVDSAVKINIPDSNTYFLAEDSGFTIDYLYTPSIVSARFTDYNQDIFSDFLYLHSDPYTNFVLTHESFQNLNESQYNAKLTNLKNNITLYYKFCKLYSIHELNKFPVHFTTSAVISNGNYLSHSTNHFNGILNTNLFSLKIEDLLVELSSGFGYNVFMNLNTYSNDSTLNFHYDLKSNNNMNIPFLDHRDMSIIELFLNLISSKLKLSYQV